MTWQRLPVHAPLEAMESSRSKILLIFMLNSGCADVFISILSLIFIKPHQELGGLGSPLEWQDHFSGQSR